MGGRVPDFSQGINVGIRKTQCTQDGDFARFHDAGVTRCLMVQAQSMQGAVHAQVRIVRHARLALFARLARHHRRAQHDVGRRRVARVGEGEYVGRVVAAAKIAIQRARASAALTTRRVIWAGHLTAARSQLRKRAGLGKPGRRLAIWMENPGMDGSGIVSIADGMTKTCLWRGGHAVGNQR